jgi:hypothetical protein
MCKNSHISFILLPYKGGTLELVPPEEVIGIKLRLVGCSCHGRVMGDVTLGGLEISTSVLFFSGQLSFPAIKRGG